MSSDLRICCSAWVSCSSVTRNIDSHLQSGAMQVPMRSTRVRPRAVEKNSQLSKISSGTSEQFMQSTKRLLLSFLPAPSARTRHVARITSSVILRSIKIYKVIPGFWFWRISRLDQSFHLLWQVVVIYCISWSWYHILGSSVFFHRFFVLASKEDVTVPHGRIFITDS